METAGISSPLGLRVAVVPNEGAIARPRKKSRIDEGAENSLACVFIEAPQALGLHGGQAQPRHLEKLAADPSYDVLNRSFPIRHRMGAIHRQCQRAGRGHTTVLPVLVQQNTAPRASAVNSRTVPPLALRRAPVERF